jgi:septum formation protein
MLALAGFTFEVDASGVDETVEVGRGLSANERSHRAAQSIADAKVEAVAERRRKRGAAAAAGEVYLAADTIVVLGGEILGKPRNDADAARMLGALSGHRHSVITAFALRRGDDDRYETTSVLTDVLFKPLTTREIAEYVATGEPRDKAGAYAVQGIGAMLVRAVYGSHSNVIGLPLVEVIRGLRDISDLQPKMSLAPAAVPAPRSAIVPRGPATAR